MKRISLLLALLAAVCATIASAAPTPTVTVAAPTELSGAGDQYFNAGTVWFRPAGAGSFTLNATATGVDSVKFPDVSAVSGWSGSTGGKDTSSPYASPVAYTWTSGATAPGAQTVSATTATDETFTATVTIGADSTPPAGQTVTLTGGPFYGTASVPLTIARGSDAGAGLAASSGDVVERAAAPLQGGNCSAYGQFAAITLAGGADTSVSTGSCYRWQVKVQDNVGNVSTSVPSADAKVDTTPPTAPSLLFTGLVNAGATGNVVYYRPSAAGSFTVSAAASDAESGVASYNFPSIPGTVQVGTQGSKTFAFTSLSATSGPLGVTATNAAGLTSPPTSFTLVPDSTPPTLTARCNGKPCLATAYAGPVRVTFEGTDTPGSGVDEIRYTTNGALPTESGGYEYTSGIVVRSLTHLKVRAFDKAGNATSPLSLTIRSRADRLVFAAPSRITVGTGERFVNARLSSTQQANVLAVMTGRGLATPVRWRFVLEHGTWLVQLRLPGTVRRGQMYTLRWTITAGTRRTTRVTQVRVR